MVKLPLAPVPRLLPLKEVIAAFPLVNFGVAPEKEKVR
jgi:hypothetical protein